MALTNASGLTWFRFCGAKFNVSRRRENGLTKMDWRLVNHGLGLAQIFPTSSNTAHTCRGDRLPKDASITF